MLIQIKLLHGAKVLASDGAIGSVDEVYFDDVSWKVRYLVINTSGWPLDRMVLIHSDAIGRHDWDTHTVELSLTREQVKNSPDIDADQPDHHLRSTKAVTGYHIAASDGHIGHVQDFIIDDTTWQICYLAVETNDWWSGKKVLLPLNWIDSINWPDNTVVISASRCDVHDTPVWDIRESITTEVEEQLYDYFAGRQHEAPGNIEAPTPVSRR